MYSVIQYNKRVHIGWPTYCEIVSNTVYFCYRLIFRKKGEDSRVARYWIKLYNKRNCMKLLNQAPKIKGYFILPHRPCVIRVNKNKNFQNKLALSSMGVFLGDRKRIQSNFFYLTRKCIFPTYLHDYQLYSIVLS